MKAWAYLKLMMKGLIKQIHVIILTSIIFPVVMGLVMANFQEDSFIKENKSPFIEIMIKDEDNSEMSKSLITFLKGDELKNIIAIKDSEGKRTITLIISKGYEDKIKSNEELPLILKQGNKTEGVSLKIAGDVIQKYHDRLLESFFIEKSIANKNLSEDKKINLYKEVKEKIVNISRYNSINESIVEGKRTLTGYEYFSVTLLSYLILILIMGIVQGGYVEKETGVTNRIKASPITAIANFNYGVIGMVIYVMCILAMYIGVYKVLGLSFKGSMPLLILIVFVSSIFTVAIASLVAEIIGKKHFNIIATVFMVIQIILGGTFGPLKEFTSNEFVRSLGRFSPDILITKVYNGYLIKNNFNSISRELLYLLGISVIAYILCLVIIRVKEEVV